MNKGFVYMIDGEIQTSVSHFCKVRIEMGEEQERGAGVQEKATLGGSKKWWGGGLQSGTISLIVQRYLKSERLDDLDVIWKYRSEMSLAIKREFGATLHFWQKKKNIPRDINSSSHNVSARKG
ncbi:hypothetical protein J6590_070931 [Homalodisca vitripennis]|nr:hypothetical protein J6590_070931 [Homalodisca vitripennis]